MKKHLVITLTCVVASLLFFGNFKVLHSSSENSEELREAWEKAEKAIETANNEMIKLEKKLVKYKTEYKTLQASGTSLAATMWNPLDIAKGLFTNAHPMIRLLELQANIAFVYGQMHELNGILKERETARNNALRAYNNSTSQTVSAIQTPRYYNIPQFSIPCENYCGTKFSSTDVGFENLGYAAEWTHKTTCNTSDSPEGCGDSYYTCNGKQNGIEEAKRHKPRTCGKMIKYKSAYNNKIYSKKCGAGFRNCKNPTFLHNQYLSGTWLEFSTKHAEKGNNDDVDDETAQNEQTPSTTPSQVDNSPNCDSCTTGGCSSCPITYACGVHSGHPSEASSHAMQASCSLSNNWMQTCTVTNFYACQTHTCVFPTVPCGNASCTQSVAFREEHRRWCINANKYWSCSTTQPMDPNEYHRTRTCTRYKALRQERDPLTGLNTVVWGTCGEQWDMCDTRCWNATGGFGTHQE